MYEKSTISLKKNNLYKLIFGAIILVAAGFSLHFLKKRRLKPAATNITDTNIIVYCIHIMLIIVHCNSIYAQNNMSAKINMNFDNIKTRDLLHILTQNSHKNIIISEQVTGRININLKQTTWCEALDIVLQNKHLIKQETENIITIMPINNQNPKEQTQAQPTVFNLHHASADNIAKILNPSGILSASGKSSAETRTNALVITDNNSQLKNVKNLLEKIDVPVKQIAIEARIVNADSKFVQELGLEFGTITNKTNQEKTTQIKSSPGRFNFAIAALNNKTLLDIELTALENQGRGKVISSPKLLTADRQAAYIESGSEIPYQEKTKEGNTSTAFKKAVLSLKVTPEVTDNNAINLIIQLNQDKVSHLTINGVPAIDTRKIQTQALVSNGGTIVLGGIYEWSDSHKTTCVPVLGYIPILGLLFQKQETKLERKELLIFVTPKIIDNQASEKI